MLKAFFVCDKSGRRFTWKPHQHLCERAPIKTNWCDGALQPAFYASDLLKKIEEKILWINKNIKKDCELKTEVLFELQSLADAFKGEI